jgi:hypothetical protein
VTTASEDSVVEWLLDGDPVIRWQVLRDLLDEPEPVWEEARRATVESGWVADMLDRQGPDGRWPKGRWTDSVWALLLLVACGLPEDHPSGRAHTEEQLARLVPADDLDPVRLLKRMDLCHLGFWLGLGSYFLPGDERLRPLSEAVLTAQLDDGGWNCRARVRPTRHSSFHTTFNVLEGLRVAFEHGVVAEPAFRASEARALEFVLAHRLYRSDRTGEVIQERFTHLTYPWHWHYTVLRGLDYVRLTHAMHDGRLDDSIRLVRDRRRPNGRWPLQKRIPGTLLVEMEKPGTDSRWNTLRALRVLRAAVPPAPRGEGEGRSGRS